MSGSWNRRDFTAALVAAVSLPRRALSDTVSVRTHRRFSVLSLFHPQVLLLHSTQSLLLQLDSTMLCLSPYSVPIRIQISLNRRFTVNCNNANYTVEALRATSLNGEAASFTLAVPPPALHGTIQRQYVATLDLQVEENALRPVLTMDLEAAVERIVLAESPANAPIAYLLAQSIVARSFLVSAATGHRGFDFCDTTHCQCLREAPRQGSLYKSATQDTAGRYLTYQDRPLAAMYSRSCGGRTRTLAELGLPSHFYPYYSVACKGCLSSPESWRRSEVPQRFAAEAEGARIGYNRVYGWSAIPSNNFVRTGQTIKGAGIGHGIGLCQRGAIAMSLEGEDCNRILAYFYPNTGLGRSMNAAAG